MSRVSPIEEQDLAFVDTEQTRSAEWIERATTICREIVRGEGNELEIFKAMQSAAWMWVQTREQVWADRYQQMYCCVTQRNIGLVYAICIRFRVSDNDELLSEGNFALMRAARRYDPWSGWKFSTYACTAITRAMRRYMTRRRLPYTGLEEAFFEEDHRGADPRVFDEQDCATLNKVLERNAAQLSEAERITLIKRFFEGCTYEQTGQAIGLSKERARQLQLSALEKLKGVFMELLDE